MNLLNTFYRLLYICFAVFYLSPFKILNVNTLSNLQLEFTTNRSFSKKSSTLELAGDKSSIKKLSAVIQKRTSPSHSTTAIIAKVDVH